jgi:hypothetical protein
MGLPTSFLNKFAVAVATTTSTGVATTTICTHSSSLKNPDGTAGLGGVLDRLLVYNSDDKAHIVKLYRVPAGGSAGSSTLIDYMTLPSLASYVFEGPLYGASGDLYSFLSDAASSSGTGAVMVAVQAYYHEMA